MILNTRLLKRFRWWLSPLIPIGISDELTVEAFVHGKRVYYCKVKGRCPTNAGFAEVAGLVGNTGSPTAFTYLALGTGSTAAAPAQTTLVAEITDTGLARHVATVSRVTTTVANDTLQLLYEWTATGVKILREIGAFNAGAAGDMLARKVFAALTTEDTMVVKMTYKFPFTAA